MNTILRSLLIVTFFTACKMTNPFSAPKVQTNNKIEDAKEQIYADNKLPAAIESIKTASGVDDFSKVIKDPTVLLKSELISNIKDCSEDQSISSNKPSYDDIAENEKDVRDYIEQTQPELKDLSKDELIKHNFKKLGGSSEAIDQALCFFNKHKDSKFSKKLNKKYQGSTSIKNKKYMVVQDFTLSAAQKRFFLICLEDDPKKGKKAGDIDVMYSSHGMGNKEDGYNNELDANHFSNKRGSNLTPRGFMISGARGVSSKGWKWNMQLDGIQKGLNDNNRDRLVYFHPGVSSKGDYDLTRSGRASSLEDNPDFFDKKKDGSDKKYSGQWQTYGCTAVSPEYAEEVYDKTSGNALYYNFTKHEKELGPKYCGSDLLLKN